MIFSCEVIRKHLLMDKHYVLQLQESVLMIREHSDQPAKNQIAYKIDQGISAFGIRYMNKIKWFTGKAEHLQTLKNYLQNRIFISGISVFYSCHELLGQGASCKVILIKNLQTHTSFAAKCISKEYIRKKKTSDRFDRLVNEINILRALKAHPNLVRMQDIFEGENSYYIIFDYLEGETLYKYVKQQHLPLPEASVRSILHQILIGLMKCHQQNIIHRDMKMENVVLTKKNSIDNVKIIDFGLAIFNTPDYPFSVCGTPGYIAPEILNYEDSKYKTERFQYTPQIDMFGVGAMLYRIMTKQPLFESEKTKDLLHKNAKCLYVKHTIPHYTNILNQILYGLLEYNPKKRLTADQALELLSASTIVTLRNESTRNIVLADEFQVPQFNDIIQCPYLFPNRKLKKELFFNHSYHVNDDYQRSEKTYLPSFSIRQESLLEQQKDPDFIIEYQLRLREKQSGLWLPTYCCFLFMLLKAFQITGKMVMCKIYDYIYQDPNFANVQWILYEIAAPLGLPLLSKLLIKSQFRFILFFSSLGSILFIAPLQYATLCDGYQTSYCNIQIMWTLTVIVSLFSGLCKTVLLFTMLYYVSNLASGKEKIIYYSFFYFIHQFQWLNASLIGNLISHFCVRQTVPETLNHFYIILIIGSVLLCCFFLTLPEESKKSRFQKFQRCINKLLVEKCIENQKAERLMQQDNLFDQLLTDDQDCVALSNKEQNTRQFITIQCFSFDESELRKIFEPQTKSSEDFQWVYVNQPMLSIEEYAKNNYYQNLCETFRVLLNDGYIHFLTLLFNVGCIYAFILLQLPNWMAPQQKSEFTTIYEGYLYVGIGQIFGCFYMGLFGDFYQKIIGLYYILGVYQLGCLLAWCIYVFQIDFLIFFMSFVFGFCCSAMISTTVSFQIVQFRRFIYAVDLMYILFSISFSLASGLYMITNYSGMFNGLILLQSSGILGLFSTWRIHNILKIKFNC